MTDEKSMTFLDHLDELRSRLIKALLSVLLCMIVTFTFSNEIIKWLLYPPMIIPNIKAPFEMMRPVITQVQGLMMVKIQIGLIGGIILSLPVIFFQIWRFIAPALKTNEKKYAIPTILIAILFFLAGAAFAFLIIIPISLNFLLTMGSIDPDLGITVENMIDLDSYLGFVTGFMFISGLTFELPVVSFFLGKIGVLSSDFMRKYWRHAVIASLTLSAIVTPTTDIITMSVVAMPIIILWEASIWVVKMVEKKNK